MAEAKQFLALVQEKPDGSTVTTPVPKDPENKNDLKRKLNGLREETKMTKESLKACVRDSDTRYKRPQWAHAEEVDVFFGKRSAKFPVELTDNWGAVKMNTCTQLDIQPDNFVLELKFKTEQLTKTRRGKPVNTEVGELSVWEAQFVLKRAKAKSSDQTEGDCDSSSFSSS